MSSLIRVAALSALMCLSTHAVAQLQYTDVLFTLTSEAFASQGVDPFDTDDDSDERERIVSGRFDNIVSTRAAIAGGVGESDVTLVAGAESSRIEFVCDLDVSGVISGQSDEASGSGAAGLATSFSVNQEFIASISASAELFPDPGVPFGSNVLLANITFTGFDPMNPSELVQFTIDLNTLFNPGQTQGQFFEVITLKPGFIYTLGVSGGASALASDDGSATNQSRALINFLLVLDDQDEDGLVDTWETEGIDTDGDGDIELDLPALGADPMRKTLFVEVDSQSGWPVSQSDLDSVASAFNNAPVPNPDGSQGITLVFERDELDLPSTTYTDSDIPPRTSDIPQKLGALKEAHFGTAMQRMDEEADQILEAKRQAYRYLVYGGRYNIEVMGTNGPVVTQASGFAEINGNDFFVSPDGIGFQSGDAARTIMHELGHTLGLRHGGCDDVNFKPNYISVMNYAHQTAFNSSNPALIAYNTQLAIDYSRVALPTLDETSLSESVGVSASEPSLIGRLFIYSSFTQGGNNFKFLGSVGSGSTPVDWDHDGSVSMTSVPEDINNVRNVTISDDSEQLKGHDDWASLSSPLVVDQTSGAAIATGDSTIGTPEFTALLRDEILVGLDGAGDPPCPADLTGDGNADFFDVSFLLTNSVDYNGDASFDFFDISAFLQDLSAGVSSIPRFLL